MALTAARNVAGARVGAKVHRAPRVAPVSGSRAARGMSVYAFKVTLKTPSGQKVVECSPEDYILDVAQRAGIDLPYSCRSGSCSSCAGIVEAGTVDQSDQSFLTDAQMRRGLVLTCVACPTSNVTIVTHKEDQVY